MSDTHNLRWLTLSAATFVSLAAAVGFLATASTQAAQHTVSIGDVTVPPGGSVAVDLDATAPPGGIGAVDITVAYDTEVVEATACTLNSLWDFRECKIDAVAGAVKVRSADVDGLGDGSLATITFLAVGGEGKSSALELQVKTFALPDEIDIQDTLGVTNGSITVATPTPTAAQPGDCTGDGGAANIVDVLRLLRHIGDPAVSISCKAGDCTGDGGAANIVDILRLLRHTGDRAVPLSC